jgi:NAD(P)H-dependent FMN reductase
MTTECRLLMISGSLRRNSTNTAVLRTACAAAPRGAEAELYEGLGELPHFNPGDDGEVMPPAVAQLRTAVRTADALILSTPEYAGSLPGSFKNLLDWLIGDDQAGSLDGKSVCWANPSTRGARLAYQSLRTVLSYANAVVVEDACVDVPLTAASLDAGGLVADREVAARLSEAVAILVAHVLRTPARGAT